MRIEKQQIHVHQEISVTFDIDEIKEVKHEREENPAKEVIVSRKQYGVD